MKKLSYTQIALFAFFILFFGFYGNTQDLVISPGTKLTVKSGTTLNVINGNLLLQDNLSKSPSLLDEGNISITGGGEARVEQYISKDTWHIVSSPVTGATADSYLWMYLYNYIESTGVFNSIGWAGEPLILGNGYFVWSYTSNPYGWPNSGDLAVLEGVLNNSNVSISLDYTAGYSNPGWNLVGNPFPCALDWNGHGDWNRNNVDASIYVYDVGSSGGSSGNYRVYNYSTGVGTPSGNDGIIAATQGFWVTAGSADASLTLPQSQRLHSNKPFYKKSKNNLENLLRIKVSGVGTPYFCETIVAFHDESTTGYDGMYDAFFIEGSTEAPYLYTVLNGIDFCMNLLPFNEETRKIPLHFMAPQKDLYFLDFLHVKGFPPELQVFLEDKLLNKLHTIKEFKQYAFTADQLMDPHRFNILFNYKADKEDEEGQEMHHAEGVKIYAANQQVYVLFSEDQFKDSDLKAHIRIFNLIGQEVISIETHDCFNMISMIGKDANQYIVKVIRNKKLETRKVYIY